MRRGLVGVVIVAWACTGAWVDPAGAQAPALAPGLVFTTELAPQGSDGRYEVQAFSAAMVDGKRVAGQPASDKAVARAVTARWKDENNYWGNMNRLLPTGGEGMAVKYPVDGAFDLTNHTIAVELRGRGWKADSGREETLVTAAGDGGALVLLSDGKGNLVLRSTRGDVAGPAPASLDKVHSLIATFDGAKATIYWDGLPVGSGPAAGLPTVKTVTLGQVDAGPGDNKDIIRCEIHGRALIQAEVSRWHLDMGVQPSAHITLVERTKPISIDGVLEPGEWDDAARITGLVRVGGDAQFDVWGPASLAADQSVFYVTYDQDYLYVGHHSPPPERIAGQTQIVVAMLKRTMDKHDDALVLDDNIKITTLDQYPDVTNEKRIYVNGKDTTYEFLPLAWNPEIRNKSRLTDTGWWVEEAIDWKDLNMGAPAPGKTVHINLLRGWKQELDENHMWTWGRYDAATGRLATERNGPNSAGAVTLAGATGVVVRLDEVGPLNQGRLDIKGTVVNLTGAEKKLAVTLDSNSGVVSNRQELTVAAGARQSFRFTGTITDFKTSLLTLRVRDVADGTEYLAQGWPVRRRYEPEIYTRNYRSLELVAFENNFEYLSETPVGKIKTKLTIVNRETGRTMFASNILMSSYSPRHEVSTRNWPVGTYDVTYRFKSGWKNLAEAKSVYERVPLPPWWDSAVGNEEFEQDVVPYPWTDMAVNGTTLDCWGRRYHFGESLLPHAIETAGRNLLRAPMTIKAVAADGTVLSSDTAKCAKAEWTTKKKTCIEGLREIGNETFAMRNEFRAEYDGFIWVKLTIVPKTGKTVTLKELTLDIPVTPEFSDVMNCYEYGLNNCGKIKAYTGTTVPLWIGNGAGGIQWLNECDGSWFVKDIKTVAHIVPGAGEGATLREEMINVPTEFTEPHTIEFGFVATPNRPKLKRTMKDPDHWGLHGEIGGYWYPVGQEFAVAPDYGFRGGWRPCGTISPYKQYCYSGLTRCYITTGAANMNDPDGQHFGDEWLAAQGTRLQGVVLTTQASKRYVNYFVWRHWNAMQTQYPYQNWYYDGPAEASSANAYAGAGYVTRDGRRVATKGILGARELCRRMYNILIRWYPFGMVGFHSSGMMNAAYYGFSTHTIDGENFNTIIGPSQPTYVGALTPEKFRAEYLGYNQFGNENIFMAQGRMGWDEAKAMGGADNLMDHLHGLFLLHDNYPPGWVFGKNASGVLEEAGKRCWDAIDKHDLFSPFYTFVPYWEQKVVTPPFPEFYATFYTFKHQDSQWLPMKAFSLFHGMTAEQKAAYRKAICIFYNHSDYQGEMRLKVDWKALGFNGPEGVTAENAVHSIGFAVETTKNDKGEDVHKAVFPPNAKETARIEGDEVVFPMTKWNYRMIVLQHVARGAPPD
ncbi:MAG: DUF6067 family protein [Kiritimatiellae bacterium]|nr:DUF6067 family protein [Kiritimatiellia bacterium]